MENFLKKLYQQWKHIPLRWKSGALSIIVIAGILSLPGFVQESSFARLHQADLYFLDVPSVAVGQVFTVELRVKTNGTQINAIGFTLLYNPNYLQIMNMTTENSFCTYYLDNTFDNQSGTVKLSCGLPKPGFLGDSLAVRLSVRALTPGDPAILADPKSVLVLANDGKGSNIVKSSPKLTLHIQQL